MNTTTLLLSVGLIIFGTFLVSCEQKKETNSDSDQTTYANPFDYCNAVENIDTPGSEYNGPKVPDIISEKLRKDMGVSESMPVDVFNNGTFWRCMNGNVYACNVGANLPCQERGDFSKEPNQGMLNYCQENPSSDYIPMYASGRATVYEWKCDGSTPEIIKQIAETDEAGYIKNIWYEITL
ncbi:MAG: hypothetical protein O6849_03390 [Candidatus Dadabacteria bacterium]|nr:hypothetical protein [Candidatus Dadabacteria bacterium]